MILTILNTYRLLQIFQKCPKLERLLLESDKYDGNTFFTNLAKCLPTAANLRDLRYILNQNSTTLILLKVLFFYFFNSLNWKFLQISPAELLSFLNALKRCPKFERFSFLAVHECSSHAPWDEIVLSSVCYALLENSLVKFVKEMPHLVALCLAGLAIDCNGAVKRRLIEEVLPERPAFWCHLSRNLPSDDPSIPKIHYEDLVYPMEEWYSPPRF